MSRILPDRALGAAVSRIERTAADNAKRAITLVLNESDRRVVAQIARQLGISSATVSRATWVVSYAPELVPRVMSGEMIFNHAVKVANERRPNRRRPLPANVVQLTTTDHVRINAAWVAEEVAQKVGRAVDVLTAMPRPEDVAVLLRSHTPALNERVARAAAWLAALDANLKGE